MRFLVPLVAILSFSGTNAFAYRPLSHDHVTRQALQYLETHAQAFPETAFWLTGANRAAVAETLSRAAVDADYRSDTWLDAWFHRPFAGAYSPDGWIVMFTTFSHYLDIARAGRHWPHDGYSFERSTREGVDSYLDKLSVRMASGPIDTCVSNFGRCREAASAGQRDAGIISGAPASRIIFPPADVVAETAWAAMIRSARARSSRMEAWDEQLTLVSGVFSSRDARRHFARGEVEGLPERLDALGLALHLAQDLTVPHHALITADLCHLEYEMAVDRLSCGAEPTRNKDYVGGTFAGEVQPECDRLYDPALVERLRAVLPAADPTSGLVVRERLQEVARLSARWDWRRDHGLLETVLPGSTRLSADSCRALVALPDVASWIHYHYNLAVAVTTALFENAAREYESAGPAPRSAP